MTDTDQVVLPQRAPAVPAARIAPRTPPAPVSPDVTAADPAGTDADLPRLLTAFRVLQMQHARVLHHESTSRGLNATDTRFVFFLNAAGGHGVTPKQAGEYLELTTGAMTSLIDRLEKHGHLERRPNPEDRRSVLLHLTPSGTAVAREVGAVYSQAFQQVVAPSDRAVVAAAFEGFATALERHHRSSTE
ncbi:MarR family transcriptional regulator [Curtobacterium flaccumfaciens pv. flaccumfaciens]|uniref:MarR family winged helix-turn-helix transcriptional regulator n=1 Tax=Curtobacterium poinsettiae TaxID=159612 RepID=UPI00217E39F1|nr:MarR family transcriptional regulator [Curtobacterium flaccumfaciens]MCS6564300.1 MarR family transcriptional regulator [Curtobacterium flaccumfaciens pv. flaccumfaciens]